MKREFELPELRIQAFLATDIITTSPDVGTGGQDDNEIDGDTAF